MNDKKFLYNEVTKPNALLGMFLSNHDGDFSKLFL